MSRDFLSDLLYAISGVDVSDLTDYCASYDIQYVADGPLEIEFIHTYENIDDSGVSRVRCGSMCAEH